MEHIGIDSDLKSLSLKASVRAGFPWLFSQVSDAPLALPKALRADAKTGGPAWPVKSIQSGRSSKEVGPQIITRRRCHRETPKGGR